MAGRGTDIQLGGNLDMRLQQEVAGIEDEDARRAAEERIRAQTEVERQRVREAGGLYVIGTERHESRRIDNQLRGRSGRQGDPGKSRFYLSLEDDLMRIFGSERMDGMLRRLGLQQGEAIIHPWINKAVARAQEKVEARNFDIRKNLLKFDNVMNDQRTVIFEQRREFMGSDVVSDIVTDMRGQIVEDVVSSHIPERAYAEQWDLDGLHQDVDAYLGLDLPVREWGQEEGIADEEIRDRLADAADRHMAQKAAMVGPDMMRQIEKAVLLQTIDHHWREHLQQLEQLRQVIGFRGYGQRDPLNEYKTEAFVLFESLLTRLRQDVTAQLARVQVTAEPMPLPELEPMEMHAQHIDPDTGQNNATLSASTAPAGPASSAKVARNAPCPCGSGKKYKHCHGKIG
jgi:preprotein translocase subunit SecA